MNKVFNLYKTGTKKATILIYGVVGDVFSEEGISEKKIAEELLEYGDLDEITVRINSPGGSVTSGIAIYNALKNNKAKKIVEIDGLCGSIATVIAMCGDKRIMNSATTFMIHNPLTMAFGSKKELEKSIERLEQIKNDVIEIYNSVTNLGKEKLEKMMDDETYLSPEEALENGFITEINKNVDKNITNYIQEYLNYRNIHKEKEEEEKMTKEELKAKFPDVYNEIMEEGEKTGGQRERERLKKLDEFSNSEIVNKFENIDAIIQDAKYVNVKSFEEISSSILLGKIKIQGKEEKKKEEIDPLNFAHRIEDALNLGEIEGSAKPGEDDRRNAFLKAFNEI
ncbi:ATP-dependent Clp endopeptidase, proteolytic subunit ClpP [Cetobacterium ceti]|uniref:ATP-dependent Clp protease proteolytic subunit n=1 Tax=Cetobacterium ceti TaxID=180163 RepID=A0A1T4QCL5_9FUSO|nr:head maturation protease, ClpP-related [Cetobacterium ceti]SKA01533.1 ATP-dependent Clp endopeptidase, proteolytic subunit ClpP [Cetobacterium ceti]